MSYLKFLWHSKNEHRIHSPFVYELQMNVFKDGMYYSGFDYIAKYLEAHPTTKHEKKKLRQIFRLVNHLRPRHSIQITPELNTYSLAMALPSKENAITIFCNDQEKNNDFPKTITCKRKDQLSQAFPSSDALDFIFIQCDKDLLKYIDLVSPHLHDDTCIVINEPYNQQEIWNQVIDSKQFNVSIDLYDLGVLFLKPTQTIEHFVLRA